MIILTRTDPDYPRAVAEFSTTIGYDVTAVLTPGTYKPVRHADGRLDMLLSRDGVRALARFAPRADAVEAAEQFMRDVPPARHPRDGAV